MSRISGIIAKLKNVKHIELLACGGVVAVVLFVYFSFASCSGSSVTDTATSGQIASGATDYCSIMQARLEKTVSEISGVGNASVVINWDKSVGGGTFGSVTTENPKALGALIVCDGGASTKVKLDVIYAVSTLLDLSIEKIIVYPKSN